MYVYSRENFDWKSYGLYRLGVFTESGLIFGPLRYAQIWLSAANKDCLKKVKMQLVLGLPQDCKSLPWVTLQTCKALFQAFCYWGVFFYPSLVLLPILLPLVCWACAELSFPRAPRSSCQHTASHSSTHTCKQRDFWKLLAGCPCVLPWRRAW